MPVDWMIRLYPQAWRERYADEMLALLEQAGATPRTALDLALGACDAWLQPLFREREVLSMVNPLRKATLIVFCAWVVYVLAGLIFYATLDDNPLSQPAHSTLALQGSVLVVQAGAALSLLAVLAGALPIGLAVLRQSLAAGRRDNLCLMFGVPLVCLAVLVVYFAAMVVLYWNDPRQAAALFVVFQGLFVLAAVVSAAAVSAAVIRSEPFGSIFRLERVAALLAALSMALTLLALVAWGASAVSVAPQVFYTAPGWTNIDTAHTWLLAAVAMSIATAVALVTAIRAFVLPQRTSA
jgi:hypothetical protein